MSAAVLFGKLPAHGDFVARGMDDAWQADLDVAISRAMQRAMERFDHEFEERFLAAPPWRCAIERGGSYLGGALAPSLDQAGRLFPVFLAQRASSLAAARDLAAGCEELLFAAIPGQWTADMLWQEAGEITAPADSETSEPPPAGWWLDGGDSLPAPAPHLSGTLPETLLLEMIAVTEQIA